MNYKKWHIWGFVFISIFGVFLHFAYGLSDEAKLVGYFGAVNESLWEHLKLIFWPVFLFSLIEFFAYGKNEKDFFAIKMCSLFCSLMFLVVFFYTYSGILGFSLSAVDIALFFVSSFLNQYISYRLLTSDGSGDNSDSFRGFIVLMLLAVCFIIWTYNPPMLGIFWE